MDPIHLEDGTSAIRMMLFLNGELRLRVYSNDNEPMVYLTRSEAAILRDQLNEFIEGISKWVSDD